MPRPTTGRVLQIQSNEIVRIWNSQAEIVREFGYKNPMISRAINTGCKAYGSYWRKENLEFKGRIFPQVGDVWIDEDMNIKLLIICISKYNGSFDCLVHDMDSGIIYTKTLYFLDDCKYLGKSKVNISNLFKTENE